jgi:hypothetical protein
MNVASQAALLMARPLILSIQRAVSLDDPKLPFP